MFPRRSNLVSGKPRFFHATLALFCEVNTQFLSVTRDFFFVTFIKRSFPCFSGLVLYAWFVFCQRIKFDKCKQRNPCYFLKTDSWDWLTSWSQRFATAPTPSLRLASLVPQSHTLELSIRLGFPAYLRVSGCGETRNAWGRESRRRQWYKTRE